MSTPALHIRPAAARDLEAVATIYNDGIRGRLATFETEERRAADLESWLGAANHPFLVAETEQARRPGVVGWVRVSTYRLRPFYAGVGEFSVYVGDSLRGRGIGDALMGASSQPALVPACGRCFHGSSRRTQPLARSARLVTAPDSAVMRASR
jgi:phosphinothricin acetyltransferase